MARRRLRLAKERLVPFEAARDVAYANNRPCTFHCISAIGLTRIEQMGTLRDGRDSPRGRMNREDHESQGSPTAGGATVANMKNCSIKSNLDNTAARLRRVGSSNWLGVQRIGEMCSCILG